VRALRLHGAHDVRLADEADPQPRADEVLLEVGAVGLCGSDRHWFVEGNIGDAALQGPLVLGHEFAGTIMSGPRAGERVALDPAIPCGSCAPCVAGRHNLCVATRFAGHGTTDGALRSVLAWPERLANPLPDSLSDVEGALAEPLGVALHALDLGGARPGTTAGVFGCGPIGLLLVQLLRMVGLTTVLATDPLPHRLAAAGTLGALALGEGEDAQVDLAFEAAGEDEALADALRTLRPGGTVVVVGIPAGDRLSLAASTARRKGLRIVFCRRMQPADHTRAIALAAAGRIDLAPLVSGTYPLAEGPAAFEALEGREGLKLIVEPQR
jgi:L-iditol 2-dehydrogenase